jgi:hypothetical protein
VIPIFTPAPSLLTLLSERATRLLGANALVDASYPPRDLVIRRGKRPAGCEDFWKMAASDCYRFDDWEGAAIERAPFFPTARTAKKWLSVETPFSTACPAASTKS